MKKVDSTLQLPELTSEPPSFSSIFERFKSWENQPLFVVGCGPSLQGFDFSCLQGYNTVGINLIIRKFVPDILFFADLKVWSLAEREPQTCWNFYNTTKAYLKIIDYPVPNDCYVVKRAGVEGVSREIDYGIFHGNHSGYSALSLALVLKANPIYLLGYDYTTSGRLHSHDNQILTQRDARVHRNGLESLHHLKCTLKRNRNETQIYNLNPDSNLKVFPFKTLTEVLK